jgi:amino acid adenylation domain-containing protein/non-ribosomal peptide synthase protein (TIGR01720 family)
VLEINLTGNEIAVIGMAGKFPGAKDCHQFWSNLKNGVESLCFFSDETYLKIGGNPERIKNPYFVSSNGGLLEDKEYFDAQFFHFTPREAEVMNPQTRLLLECTWKALEDAGYNHDSYRGLIGLYVGGSDSLSWEGNLLLSGKNQELGFFTAQNLSRKDFLSTRVSYCLNLRGPSITVNTACSTSLVAIHLACQDLLSGQCNMALAGGVSLNFFPNWGYLYQEGMINSPDGHCRAFDAKSAGTNGGEGVGVVVLKALDQAIEERCHIYAVIKGTAINNDGNSKIGYEAPSINGQAGVIRTCHKDADIHPESISYIEAHGTGTSIGDPIEFEALVRAFNTNKRRFCGIGSVKTNIGHLDTAAGVAGFIKTVLALKHRQLPPTLHFQTPNPKFDLQNSPFYVVNQLKDWKNDRYPLRAGVSSFGIGGTNAHIILEETPKGTGGLDPLTVRDYQLILLSAKTQSALDKMMINLGEYLKENPDIHIADAAYTLQVGRRAFNHRKMVICSNREEAVEGISPENPGNSRMFSLQNQDPPVVFVFPGLGGQYENMGRQLYEKESLFRQEMDHCFEILKPLMNVDIKEILYPRESVSKVCGEERPEKINQIEIAQIVIFTFEYALAKLLMKWGISPQAMIGYSFGEYTAACLSGVFSLEDALKLITLRGSLINKVSCGAMLSVPLEQEKLVSMLPRQLSIAIDNGDSCIVAGLVPAIEAFQQEMKFKGYLCMRLPNSHALHSPIMEPILEEFAQIVKSITLKAPAIPYISNVTGCWITVEDTVDPGYWCRHLRQMVRFSTGIKELVKEPDTLFIEIGPGRDLSALLRRYISKGSHQEVINLVRPSEKEVSDVYYILHKLGQLWLRGVKIDWSEFYSGERRYRVPLPTYPFEGQHYWINDDLSGIDIGRLSSRQRLENREETGEKGETGDTADIANWFYIPSWERSPLLPGDSEDLTVFGRGRWLVLVDDWGIGPSLVKRLESDSHEVIVVTQGEEFRMVNDNQYTLNPHRGEQYQELFDHLGCFDKIPSRIVHLWGIYEEKAGGSLEIGKSQDSGFYSLVYLVKALSKESRQESVEISIVTNNMQEVTGEENLYPGKATVISPVLVIPQEHPSLFCRSIDIILPKPGSSREKRVITQLKAELSSKSLDRVIALRGNHRSVRVFKPIRLEEIQEDALPLRKKGVYLITGGLGKIGLTIAGYLSRRFQAKLILTGRSTFPARDQWEHWLTSHDEQDSLSRKIRKLQQLESLGAKVMIFSADTADREQMKRAIARAEEQLGSINGVIHLAGLAEGDTFQVMEKLKKSECEQHFQAKVYGLMVLENLLKDKKLDFCWLMSSVSTVLGGLQFAAYAAANAFMDAFVSKHNQSNETPWISVDWDGMRQEDTVIGFKRILSLYRQGLNQVVVSDGGNLQDRIDKWVKLESFRDQGDHQKEDMTSYYPRPDLLNPYVSPQNQIEREIAGILQKLFGFEQVGVQDDFFELGGDSLRAITVISRVHKALNVISRVHKALNVEIPLTGFFKRPTIQQLAQYIEQAEKSTHSSIEPVEKKEYYTLSSAQRRLYVLQQMEKKSVGYNESQVKVLEGTLDRNKFEETFKRLIRRHECLRTSIEMMNGEPVQKIHQHHQVELAVEFYETGKDEAKELLKKFLKPFDLSQPPFIRAGLIKLGETKHILMLDMHHIVTDGVSSEIFINETIALYKNEELPVLRLQYKDYTEWQKSDRVRKAMKKQEEFWLKEFEEEIPVLNLSTDYERPQMQSFEGNTIDFEIGKEETAALKTLSLKEDVTLYILLLSVFNILLSKLTGQEDIIIGTPTAGRRHTDLHNIMGVFVNTLALRNYPISEKTFKEFLNEVKGNTLKAFENQEYQFEDLIEQVSVNRDMSRNPLFDVMFVLQNVEVEPGEKSNVSTTRLKVASYDYKRKTSKFDLTLVANEFDHQLYFTLEYCVKLFKKETIEKFVYYFKNILQAIQKGVENKISRIEIISEEERYRQLVDFNDTKTDFPMKKTINELFEEQVERTPDHIAVKGTGGLAPLFAHITYTELNQKANRLAYELQTKGVEPDTIVGIMVERSVEMIIGIIGILKAGGAYLPIDLEYSQERINYMLNDSTAKILLTSDSINRVPTPHASTLPPVYPSQSSSLAYVIYTSGSTGQPKGVMINHRAILNYIWWAAGKYVKNERMDFPLYTSISFDLTVTSIFTPLVTGNTIVVYDEEDKRLPLDRIIHEDRVGVVKLTPSHLKLTRYQPGHISTATIKRFVVGGEDLEKNLALDIYRKFNGTIEIYNEYGPTEASVGCMIYRFDPIKDDRHSVPIGIPINNMHIHILDSHLNLVPYSVPGELYIGGEGLARGYLNRPELTAEKFLSIKNRSYTSSKPNISNRIYRTGDLARRLQDGNIEFLGRIDHQVKIRGFRIELGEIEEQLLNNGHIKKAVVITNQDQKEDIHLIAYFVSDQQLSITELREYLSKGLPDYMIPSYFVALESIPLTPNGKVDRKALPKPEAKSEQKYIAPGNEIESKLVEILEKVLGVKKIGVNDNFFEIGGDSIKAIQVISRMKGNDYKIEMRDLFKNPTISKMASIVRKVTKIIDQSPVCGRSPLTPIQESFFSNDKIDPHHFNQAVLLYSKEKLEVRLIETIFSKLQEHHDALRMTFKEENGKIIQNNNGLDYPLSLKVYDLRNRENAQNTLGEKLNKIQSSINLEKGPLMKLGLFRMDDGERLLITIHHLVIDGISWRILFEDIETLYQQYINNQQLKLPLKTHSYKTWAEKLTGYANSEKFLKEKTYWADLECASASIPGIARDFLWEDLILEDTRSLSFSLSEEETEVLLTRVNKAFGTEINDILITALGTGIRRLYGHNQVLIAMEGHGREEILTNIDIGRTIGCFTCEYPVLLDFSYVDDRAQQIIKIKETLHKIPNKGIGYGILKYLTKEENKHEMTFNLSPQIRFSYLGQFDEHVKQTGLFSMAKESSGNPVSLKRKMLYDFDIIGMIINNCLSISISFSKKQYRLETVKLLLDNFKTNLIDIIEFTSAQTERKLTPSDFDYKGLSLEEFENFFQ